MDIRGGMHRKLICYPMVWLKELHSLALAFGEGMQTVWRGEGRLGWGERGKLVELGDKRKC